MCELCNDPTCPCGAVMFDTDAKLQDALRACRWILAEKLKAAEAKLSALDESGTGYSQQTVDAIVKERDDLRAQLSAQQPTATCREPIATGVQRIDGCEVGK